MTTSSSTTRNSPRTTTTRSTSSGARAALRIDLGENWTVTPSFMYQKSEQEGSWGDDLNDFIPEAAGKNKVAHFRDEFYGRRVVPGRAHDRRVDQQLRRRVLRQLPQPRGSTARPTTRTIRTSTTNLVTGPSRLLCRPVRRQRRRTTSIGRTPTPPTITTPRRAMRSAFPRPSTSACADCSASSTRSSITTSTRNSGSSRASPTSCR